MASARTAWAVAVLCGAAMGIGAQPVPPAGLGDDQERRQLRQTETLRERMEVEPQVRLDAAPTPADRSLPTDETPCFLLSRITWQIDAAVKWPWLAETLGPSHDHPVGRCIGAEGVALIAQRAQSGIAQRGYITTRVLVEPQDLSSGDLRLGVAVGRVAQTRLADPASARATLWNALPFARGDILNLRDIEQALENLQRVPSVRADIQIVPTEDPMHSDVVIAWEQDTPLRLSLSADDSGSRNTGRYQGTATFSLDHWLTLNDLLYLTVQRDLGGGAAGERGTRGTTLHYSLPLGRQLLSFTASRNRYWQNVAGALQDYIYSGESITQELQLARVAHRSASSKTTIDLRAFARQSRNFVDDTELLSQHRRTGGWELGASHRLLMQRGTLDMRLSHQQGTGAFGARPAPDEAFDEGTARMRLWRTQARLNTPVAWAARPLHYSAQFNAQAHHTRLSPQDRFAIGGRHSVRGFDGESSLSGDSGWTLRQELSMALGEGAADNGAATSAYLGLDRGCVNGPSTRFLVGRCLTGAVIGLRIGWRNTQFDAFGGEPVKRPSGFRTVNTTWGFQLHSHF